ncbi:hypothetical protein BN946_scf184993.g16 [Trametes cinnabarina]|uniref:BAH domain-containing protein n=1 Tax=Pycnoporus cinnabarinus TaxID=5643 RepID=A0A060SYX7_PYCCI|nr:hypothetical protein BN946_scf184993.g16 [Trametes cinnabarina]
MTKKPYSRLQAKTDADIAFSQMVPAYGFEVDVLVYDPSVYGGHTYRKILFKKGDEYGPQFTAFRKTTRTDLFQRQRLHELGVRRDDRRNVLVKVCWYWSRNDISKEVKSFDRSQCAPFERILSDSYDYQSPYTFQGPGDFFVRTQFMHRKKAFRPPLGAETCLCQIAYNPFPGPAASSKKMEVDTVRDAMHFCPSLDCRKWYHSSCLEVSKHIDLLPPETRGLRLLAVSPDEEVLYATFEYFYDSESLGGMPPTAKVSLPEALVMLDRSPEIVAHLPSSLLAIAQCPIVRCGGAPQGFAIGNVADVVLARRLVYAAVQNSGDPACTNAFQALLRQTRPFTPPVSEEPVTTAFWASMQTVVQSEFVESESEFVTRIAKLGMMADELGLLATPYVPYWDRREREYREVEELLGGSGFVCPKCRGAI